MTAIECQRRLAPWFVLALVLAGCSPSHPEAEPAPPPPQAASASKPSSPPRPVRAPAPADRLHLLRTSGSVEGPIPYLIVAPAAAPPSAPIVLALHGRGDSAERFARLAEQLRLPIRFIVGDGPMPWGARRGRRWFDSAAPDLADQLTARVADLVTLADAVARRWPQAPAPILLGFSQGAMLSLQALAQRPDRFAGVIALSGALLVTEGLTPATTPRRALVAAGSSDRVVPAARSRAAAAALEGLGHHVETLEFEGGHTVTRRVLERVAESLTTWTSPPR
jgi:phospholipase/carboxylesterase